MTKNRAAVALGRLAKGVPKVLSREEIARRTAQIQRARRKFLDRKRIRK